MIFLVIVFVCLISFMIVWRERENEKRARDRVFQGREALSDDTYYQRFFEKKGIPKYIAIGVRQVLSEQLQTDLSRLSSEDDFSTNLAFFFEYDSMVDVEIVCALENRFDISFSNEEAEGMRTISDIVQLVHSKLG